MAGGSARACTGGLRKTDRLARQSFLASGIRSVQD